MKVTATVAALMGSAEAINVDRHHHSFAQTEWTYPFGQNSYNDIRAQELKCIGNRNYEWHYDAATNTGSCTLNSYAPYKPYEPEHDIRAQKGQSLQQVKGQTYPFAENTYTDIRAQELKCLADRNKEWKYDASTNTATCNLKSFQPYVPFEPVHDIRAQKGQSLQQVRGQIYPFAENTYTDIRAQELKCLADRNKEWKYDASTNTATCNLKSFQPYVPFEPVHDIRAQKNSFGQVSTTVSGWTYPFAEHTYNDIRSQELKCLANRNYEWHYDGATNTGSCTLNSYSPYKPYEPEHDIRAQVSSVVGHAISNGWVYPFGQNSYNDIRSQELKCIADRNMEWHYDAVTNTGTCSKNSYSPYKPYEPEHDIRAQKK